MYCRQSYNALKPVCVFPIEVQLQLQENLFYKEYHDDDGLTAGDITGIADDDEKLLVVEDNKHEEEAKANKPKDDVDDVDLISI